MSRRRSFAWSAVALGLLLAILAIPAAPSFAYVPHGRWYEPCLFHHSLMDDPIVYPRQPGASHMHDFYGNVSTDAFSTPKTLRQTGTSCPDADDHSAYWAPEAYFNEVAIFPRRVDVSYTGNGFDHVVPFPAGVKLIAGDAHSSGPQPISTVYWDCGPHLGSPKLDHPYDCSPWVPMGSRGVRVVVVFPNCWNGMLGQGNDSAYFAYAIKTDDGKWCPEDFPNQVTELSEKFTYPITNPINPDGSMGLTLSSGAYYTMHADFMDAWNTKRLQFLVDTCVNDPQIKCGKHPPPGP